MPLSDLLFVIEYSLSKAFPAMHPLMIEDRTFFEIIDLYADMRRMQIREKKESDPNRIIRRPAGDDWF